MYPGDLICLGFCDNSNLPSADADHAFEITYNVSDDTLLINDGRGHLVKFVSLSELTVPDNFFYGFTNENGIIRPHKLTQSRAAAETGSGITLAVTAIDPVSEAYLHTLGLDITVGRCDAEGNLLTGEWIYRKDGLTQPVRFNAVPAVGQNSIPLGLHTADIASVQTVTQNGEDFTTAITLNDGSTFTAAWSSIKWRSREEDIHTDRTDPLNPVLSLNSQVKQDVQRALVNAEIEQVWDVSQSLLETVLTLTTALGTPLTRTSTIDLSDIKVRWGNLTGTVTDQSDLVQYITGRLLPYELLANKTAVLDSSSTDDQYPAAKAVWYHIEDLETRKEDKANKTAVIDDANKDSETVYPSVKAAADYIYEYAVPREDVPALVTGLETGLASEHEIAHTKTWYDVPNRTLESETKTVTTDPHLVLAELSGNAGYELSVDMAALISASEPNWLETDPADGNLRVDVTEDLALKEDKANKATVIDDSNKDSETLYPAAKAVTEWSDARFIHTGSSTAPRDPQVIETGVRIEGDISIGDSSGNVSAARLNSADALVLGDTAKGLLLEGAEERPGYNAETIALMSDVALKQDKQTFADDPLTADSPVYSVPDEETIQIEWNETDRITGAVTAKTQAVKTDGDTIKVTGTDTPVLAVTVENLISADIDNEIGLGTDGKLYNVNSINRPLSPGFYLPIIHFDGTKLEYTYFKTPEADGTYQVQCIVTNGIPAWAIQ